eukprot:770855_1
MSSIFGQCNIDQINDGVFNNYSNATIHYHTHCHSACKQSNIEKHKSNIEDDNTYEPPKKKQKTSNTCDSLTSMAINKTKGKKKGSNQYVNNDEKHNRIIESKLKLTLIQKNDL